MAQIFLFCSHILILFLMLSPPRVPGVNPTRCCDIILFTYCHLVAASILRRILHLCLLARQAHLRGPPGRTQIYTKTDLRVETTCRVRPLAAMGCKSAPWARWCQSLVTQASEMVWPGPRDTQHWAVKLLKLFTCTVGLIHLPSREMGGGSSQIREFRLSGKHRGVFFWPQHSCFLVCYKHLVNGS